MRAGRLRHRITIEKPDDAAASWNGAQTWSTYATVWARLEPTRGSERTSQETGKIKAEITVKITMRYIRGVLPSMRFSFEGRYFYPTSILNIEERNQELQIEAYEEASGAEVE